MKTNDPVERPAVVWSQLSLALELRMCKGDKLAAADLTAQCRICLKRSSRRKDSSVAGHHTAQRTARTTPRLVVTDPAMLAAIRTRRVVRPVVASGDPGGASAKRRHFDLHQPGLLVSRYTCAASTRSAQAGCQVGAKARLAKALGDGARRWAATYRRPTLANYRYMIGMERFDSAQQRTQPHTPVLTKPSRPCSANLAKRRRGTTSRVYEVGHQPKQPDGCLRRGHERAPVTARAGGSTKIGADHMAGLPYEVFIVGQQGLRAVCPLSHCAGLARAWVWVSSWASSTRQTPFAPRWLVSHGEWVQLISRLSLEQLDMSEAVNPATIVIWGGFVLAFIFRSRRQQDQLLHHGCDLGCGQHGALGTCAHVAAGHRRGGDRRQSACTSFRSDRPDQVGLSATCRVALAVAPAGRRSLFGVGMTMSPLAAPTRTWSGSALAACVPLVVLAFLAFIGLHDAQRACLASGAPPFWIRLPWT
jgi:hypothetical protein